MEKETSGSHTGLIVSSVALVAAAVYLLAPVFVMIPFLKAEQRQLIRPTAREVLFTPIYFLATWPAYQALLLGEAEFCERHGLW